MPGAKAVLSQSYASCVMAYLRESLPEIKS